MMKLKDIRTLELEITTKCNARCPQCVRNYYGAETWGNLPIMDMSLDDFKASMPDEIWRTLETVRFCGTYGDPLMHKDFTKFVRHIKDQNPNIAITINTNGGIRSVRWWRNLATLLGPLDDVFFGIDGLEDTSPLYRIDVDYHKVIRNLRAFNEAGGTSVWSYLVFRHNEHQVEEARSFSKEVGCSRFIVKSTSRFVDKQHRITDRTPVLNGAHEIIYWLEPAKGKHRNIGYDEIDDIVSEHGSWDNYLGEIDINCASKREGYLYISASGEVFPCGWLADRMYGFEAENHRDRDTIISMMDDLGGRHKANFMRTPLEEIIEEGWFKSIEESWNTNQIQRCANQCGSKSNFIKLANKDLRAVQKRQ